MDIYTVDAFTSEPFAGNPAAVVILDHDAEDAWMSAVGAEMNLSETAFVRRTGDSWSLRWFTPAVEVDLCGHATLASARVLFELGEPGPLVFETRSSTLTAERSGTRIALDFPAMECTPVETPDGLAEIIGVTPRSVSKGTFGYLLELDSPDAVLAVQPRFRAMVETGLPGVIVTAAGGTNADFTSRVFAPNVGIDEDPVTGSAHCMLGPYWAGRLGKSTLTGHQASRRGGYLEVRVRDTRVDLIGDAVIVLAGTLLH